MASHRDRDSDYVDVRVRERSRERPSHNNPLARYFEGDRRADTGAMVLRQREVETFERERPRMQRSPSPVRTRRVFRGRSESSPPPPRRHDEIDRVEVRDRIYERERPRPRSLTPSPPPRDRERDRIHIDVAHSHSIASSSPSRSRSRSPSPLPPQVIRGPIVEREVITHYTDVNHGVVYAPPPPSRPVPERERKRDTDTEVDVYTSRHRTEVDISHSPRRRRSPSRDRRRLQAPARASERDVHLNVEVDVDDCRRHHRRARSAQPPRTDRRYDPVAEEASFIEARIDKRGHMGEAYNGATRQWTIVDVPPGTERVRMDGVGGGSAEVAWKRYNGVRRSRFIPKRDGELVVASPPPTTSRDVVLVRERDRERDRDRARHRSRSRGAHDHLSVQVVDKHHRSGSRNREVDADVETVVDRGVVLRRWPPPPPPSLEGMWTEITKDLVSREAIEYMGYDYTEEEYLFYISQYLSYEDVQELVDLSDRIRRQRPRRKERHSRDELDIDVDVRHRSHSHHRPRRDDRRVYEQDIVVDNIQPVYFR